MEGRALEAARKGNIHELKGLIGSNVPIFEEMAIRRAGHTLLHVACLDSLLDLVREVLKHMPKFAEKVDPDGFSPLHIAAARGDVEIARELLKERPHLCYVEGLERRIPLHDAVSNGKVDVMEILLSTSPESVGEKTAREETVLHLAVKNNRVKVLVRCLEHLKQHKKEQLINWKDCQGNTALDLADSKNFKVVKYLHCGHEVVVEVNDPDESGLTPLDVSTTPLQRGARDREMTEILARAGAKHGGGRSNSPASRPILGDDDDIEGGNGHQCHGEANTNARQSSKSDDYGWIYEALLVVAGLIVSATYQALLQPPTIIADDVTSNSSAPALAQNIFYYVRLVVYLLFLAGNTFGFLVSVQIIICLTKMIRDKKNGQDKNIQKVQEEENQERYVFGLIMLSMGAMVLTYFCFAVSLLLTSMGGAVNSALRMAPLLMVLLLLAFQKELVESLEIRLEGLFRFLGRLPNSN